MKAFKSSGILERFMIILLTTTSFRKFLCGAIVCYKCDSISLQLCATTLNETELPFEDCGTSSLQCAMSIVDTITYRGCSSSTPSIGTTYRKTCDKNLCNKGVYPPGRLKCYQCASDHCQMSPNGKPHPCRFHHEEDECYLDIQTAAWVYRGCRSDTNHTMSNTALYCNYNGCNTATAVSILKCAVCDSNSSRGCKMDLMTSSNITQYETCEMVTTLNSNNYCFIYHKLDHVARGCSDNVTEEIKYNTDHRLISCTKPNFCNIANFPQQKCLQCNSELGNENCRFNATAVRTSFCGSPEASSCFTVEYDNWHVERGCARAPERSDINRQYECDTHSDCNATPFTRCYKCSSDINTNCATWQRPGFLEIEECQRPGANCVVATFEDGITKRGCESDHFNCTLISVVNCQSCVDSFCNQNPFPAPRLRCFQCGSFENCGQAYLSHPMPCSQNELEPLNGNKQGCFKYFDVEMGHDVRGCISDSQSLYKCILQSKNMCTLCYTDACNR